jgi:GNAT superfamily N-acetyltransferase
MDAHVIEAFDSGVPTLDLWLARRARANQVSGASRTYVVADHNGTVIGYYALASGAFALSEAPGSVRRNMPDPIPVAVLGRLAVGKAYQGQGLGVALLQDAVIRVKQAAAILGIRGILVHALSEDAKRFYERHGFVEGTNTPMMLILSLQ